MTNKLGVNGSVESLERGSSRDFTIQKEQDMRKRYWFGIGFIVAVVVIALYITRQDTLTAFDMRNGLIRR